MKPLTDTILRVRINGLKIEDVVKCDFIFRTNERRNSKELAFKSFPKDVKYDAEDNCFMIALNPYETNIFPPERPAFLDIRPIVIGNKAIAVNILKINVVNTLYNEGDIDD